MAKGDHVRVKRTGYYHHGIDIGDGWVIHFSGENSRKTDASIRRDRKQNFAAGTKVEVVAYGKCYPPDIVVERAESKLGESSYGLFDNNCEHFAHWCKIGNKKSEQVKNSVSGAAGSVGIGAATVGGVSVVSSAGAAAGLSGAGIMSGLAATGSVVGGGAIAGIIVLAAAPATVGTLTMRKIMEDNETLDETERGARGAGRTATTVGAVAGTAGTIGTIAAAGTTAGLSGAGITSGLAAIGGTVGGGMAAGTAVAIAAPAVIAAGLGYGVYKVWKWLS